jgi:hypothetical protein
VDSLGEVPSALVLDDFHMVESVPAIGSVVERLIANVPQRLKVIVASRRTPTLPVAALRARGELAELGREELKFNESAVPRLLPPSARTRRSARPSGADRRLGGLAPTGQDGRRRSIAESGASFRARTVRRGRQSLRLPRRGGRWRSRARSARVPGSDLHPRRYRARHGRRGSRSSFRQSPGPARRRPATRSHVKRRPPRGHLATPPAGPRVPAGSPRGRAWRGRRGRDAPEAGGGDGASLVAHSRPPLGGRR